MVWCDVERKREREEEEEEEEEDEDEDEDDDEEENEEMTVRKGAKRKRGHECGAVSYTHLTLPTIYSV